MKTIRNTGVCGTLAALLAFTSCTNFLEEDPKTFLSPSEYYTSEKQITAAVDGTYAGLSYLLSSDLEIATVHLFNLEYVVGHCYRPRSAGSEQNQFLLLSGIEESNPILRQFWRATYFPVENCNSVIENVSASTIISQSAKAKYLAEAYFLRAYYYFQGVRLFGDIPLKTESTKDLSEIQIPKASTEAIYNQIVADLKLAEDGGLAWTAPNGHVSLGAVKTLLAKVYLTMAGYPLQKGADYYRLAYEKSKEIIDSGAFSLFEDYKALRLATNENTGEHIFMIQREAQDAGSPFHFGLLPYPEQPISISPAYGGGLAPRKEFYDSFDDEDRRKQNEMFFYTSKPKQGDPATQVTLDMSYICKYWDETAEETGKSGANIPVYRYADVLLMCAEARAALDGGTTSDATALEAYYQVRRRALPKESKPLRLTTDQVLKERAWELCFEFTAWYDALRTHKIFDPASRQITQLIGYQAPNHDYPFKESDLIFPVPLRERELNPLLAK